MSAWDLAWFTVTALGLLVTLLLVVEARRDLKFASHRLLPLARQLVRHEQLRALKQALLLVAIGLVAFRERIGDSTLIVARNGIMATVAAVLAVNSLWDFWFRTRYFRNLRDAEARQKGEHRGD